MKKQIIAFCVVTFFAAWLPFQAACAGERGADGVTPGYGYNYPHQVPADYVYRTGRIFAPREKENSWLDSIKELFSGLTNKEDRSFPAELAMELKLHVRALAAQLIDQVKEDIDDEDRFIVSTFVNLNHLYKTSAFGRVVAELLTSEFQRVGIEVIDVRMTPALQIKEGYGEYALSRDMSQLSYVHDAQAVVVGTYVEADGQCIINARLLQQGDGLVLSSGSMVLQKNQLISALLQDEAMPPRNGAYVQLRDFSEMAGEKKVD